MNFRVKNHANKDQAWYNQHLIGHPNASPKVEIFNILITLGGNDTSVKRPESPNMSFFVPRASLYSIPFCAQASIRDLTCSNKIKSTVGHYLTVVGF